MELVLQVLKRCLNRITNSLKSKLMNEKDNTRRDQPFASTRVLNYVQIPALITDKAGKTISLGIILAAERRVLRRYSRL